jgi:hypothetical protein
MIKKKYNFIYLFILDECPLPKRFKTMPDENEMEVIKIPKAHSCGCFSGQSDGTQTVKHDDQETNENKVDVNNNGNIDNNIIMMEPKMSSVFPVLKSEGQTANKNTTSTPLVTYKPLETLNVVNDNDREENNGLNSAESPIKQSPPKVLTMNDASDINLQPENNLKKFYKTKSDCIDRLTLSPIPTELSECSSSFSNNTQDFTPLQTLNAHISPVVPNVMSGKKTSLTISMSTGVLGVVGSPTRESGDEKEPTSGKTSSLFAEQEKEIISEEVHPQKPEPVPAFESGSNFDDPAQLLCKINSYSPPVKNNKVFISTPQEKIKKIIDLETIHSLDITNANTCPISPKPEQTTNLLPSPVSSEQEKKLGQFPSLTSSVLGGVDQLCEVSRSGDGGGVDNHPGNNDGDTDGFKNVLNDSENYVSGEKSCDDQKKENNTNVTSNFATSTSLDMMDV